MWPGGVRCRAAGPAPRNSRHKHVWQQQVAAWPQCISAPACLQDVGYSHIEAALLRGHPGCCKRLLRGQIGCSCGREDRWDAK